MGAKLEGEAKYERGQFRDHLLEQYKLMRKSIEDTTTDRHTQSRFASGIATAVLGAIFYATVTMTDPIRNMAAERLVWAICAFGALFGGYTMFTLRIYLDQCERVIRAKYLVLRDMETALPAQPFTREGELRASDSRKAREYWFFGKEFTNNNTKIVVRFATLLMIVFASLVLIYGALAVSPQILRGSIEPT